jgi:DNA-binding beta-propeller fold protein YncE
MKRFLWLGLVLFFYLICCGCGDTFRPIIIPNPPTFPNPAAAHTVVSINYNEIYDSGNFVPLTGSSMVIDVSGDSDVSNANVGLAPVHAVQQTASEILVVNQSVAGTGSDSITKLNFSGTTIGSTTTISLPVGSAPSFVAVAPNDTLAYVTLPKYIPDPVNHPTDNGVGVVSTLSNNLIATITAGVNPVALAVTPDKSKLYVANQGDSTIGGFNTVDRSQRVGSPVSTTSPPVWLLARSDSQRVYVLEQDGTLAWLDTTSTSGPDALTETSISVPAATSMVYDGNLNRLYIPGGPQLAIVDVSQSAPQLIKAITIPQVPGVPSVSASAVAVAALPDGSRAYVASVPGTAQPSQVSISGILGDGTTATYTYKLTGGHDLTSGLTVVVSGIPSPNDGFNGTYLTSSASNSVAGTTCDQATSMCTFQVASANTVVQTAVTGMASTSINNLFPQVTVIDVKSNTIKSTVGIPGFPDATDPSTLAYYVPICATSSFRFMMAAGGDSTRAYLSSCDAGGVNIIDTSNDTYVENLSAPIGARAPIPPSLVNPPQNPVFLIAGP